MSEPQQDVFDAKAAGWDSNPSILQATSAAAEALKSTGLLHPGCNVLEVGCGTGLLAEKLADSLALLVGVDPSQGMIDVFKARAAARRDGKLRPLRGELASPSSLAAAAAADGGGAVPERYHLALSCLTFHHLLDIPGTLRLLRHHLEPGGSIAVLDFAKEPGSMRFHDPAHCHGVRHPGGFTPEELEAYLRGAGFEEARARVVATLQKPAHGGNGALALTIYTLAPALSKEQLGGLPLLHLSHAGPGPAADADLAADMQAVLAERQLRSAQLARQCPRRVPGQPVDGVAVVHIPKTAGTFLHELLAELLPQSGRGKWCHRGGPGSGAELPLVSATCGRGVPPPDQMQLFTAIQANFGKTCSGFTAHQDIEYFNALGLDYNSTLMITSLRHPVERVISEYYYALRAGADWMEPYKPANLSDFSGLLRLVESNGINANNLMVSHMGGGKHCAFPGAAPPTPDEQRLEAAKRNLARVCVVVLPEFMDESLVRLARAGGWASRRVLSTAQQLLERAGGRVNTGEKAIVPVDVRRTIERYNELDMQLYEHAVQLFLRQRHTAW